MKLICYILILILQCTLSKDLSDCISNEKLKVVISILENISLHDHTWAKPGLYDTDFNSFNRFYDNNYEHFSSFSDFNDNINNLYIVDNFNILSSFDKIVNLIVFSDFKVINTLNNFNNTNILMVPIILAILMVLVILKFQWIILMNYLL